MFLVTRQWPMTWRIERASAQGRTTIRLIGRVQSEYLAELKTQIESPEPHLALDLEEVTLVDVGVVRFLLACEESGIELLHCSPYIRQWMASERPGQGDGAGGRGKVERKG
jgi:hypothetical protein